MNKQRLANIVKAAAFVKAPRKAYFAMHPVKYVKRSIFLRGLRSFVTPSNGARLGAVLAVPAAIFAVRNITRR